MHCYSLSIPIYLNTRGPMFSTAGNFSKYKPEIHMACPEKLSRDSRGIKDASGTGTVFGV